MSSSPFKHLKLHHCPGTRSARVKWVLHEVVGNAFEVERVDLLGGEQHRPRFLRLNPNHAVPVLEITWPDEGRQIMIESGAIVTLLADAFPEKELAPRPGASRERADYLQMLHFGSTLMDSMLWQVRLHEKLLPSADRDSRTAARYREKLAEEVAPQLAERLLRAAFVCGTAFSAADCVVGHAVRWGRSYGLFREDVFEVYVRTLADRPAFQLTLAT